MDKKKLQKLDNIEKFSILKIRTGFKWQKVHKKLEMKEIWKQIKAQVLLENENKS